jgi:serine/threonine protein kinase
MNHTLSSSSLSAEALVGQVADEFLQRLNCGEQPDIDEYARRHPEIDSVLRQVLAALELVRIPVDKAGIASLGEIADAMDRGCLGDFRILREVGRGGMGIVYEAEQISLNRRVALKVLPFAAALDPKQLQRFKNEAQAAAQLHHQNIVPVYGVGCERGVHYYAMQFIEGQTLAKAIADLRLQIADWEKRGPAPRLRPESSAQDAQSAICNLQSAIAMTPPAGMLSTERSTKQPAYFRSIARLGVQAAEALEHAHSFGIVHRDIKPANLLVDGRGTLWVTDFGLARLQNEVGLTLTGDLLGTLRYMSPEQALGKQGLVDQRSDIYSLGATLYELFTLQPVCPSDDRQEVLRQIEQEEPQPPRGLNAAMPADLETIVLKALVKEPDGRYATAQALADDLRRFLEDKPIQAKRPTSWQRIRKWVRRHQALVVTAGVATVIILLTVVVALVVGILRVKAERERAKESYRLAREALQECVKQVTEDPRLAAGELETLRRKVWQLEADFLQKFVHLYGEGPDFEEDRGNAYLQLGNVTSKLGTRDDAIVAYQGALRIFTDLVRNHPEVARYRALLSLNYQNLGVMYHAVDRQVEAEQAYQEALAQQRILVTDYPLDSEYRHLLASSYGNLAVLYQEMGKLEAAENAYDNVVALAQTLIHDHAFGLRYQVLLANSYTNLALIYVDTKRSEKAEHVLEEALVLRRALVKADRKHPDYVRQLALTYNTLGELYQETGRSGKAEQARREALGRLEILVREHPSVADYATDLGACQVNLGNLDRDLGRVTLALDWYGIAISLCKFTSALDWYEKAIKTLETVLLREANHARAQRFLANAYSGQSRVLNHLNRHGEALHALNRAIQLSPGDQVRYHRRLDRAKTLAKLNRHAEAIAEANELLKLPEMDGRNRARLAEPYSLAYASTRDEDPVQGEQYAVQAVELLRQAITHGYKDVALLKTHSDFKVLRQRPDFQQLLVELEQRQEEGTVHRAP